MLFRSHVTSSNCLSHSLTLIYLPVASSCSGPSWYFVPLGLRTTKTLPQLTVYTPDVLLEIPCHDNDSCPFSDRILYHMPPGFALVNFSKLVSSVDKCPSLICPVMTSGKCIFLAIISAALDRVSSFEPQPVNTKQK